MRHLPGLETSTLTQQAERMTSATEMKNLTSLLHSKVNWNFIHGSLTSKVTCV